MPELKDLEIALRSDTPIIVIETQEEPRAVDLDKLAVNSAEFSGAEIEQAIISAIYSADAKNLIANTDIVIDELFRTQPLAIVMSEKIGGLRSWAKGRAVAAH
ncbi:MAG: hypothetical protein COA83_10270 [Methylophaga sp.]|nr:MAG: hypothetical protein COA83_10270 [Methylophaga sp.]